MPKPQRPLPIWFFIGLLLIAYGFLIMGAGMYELFVPPEHPPVLSELRPSIWWGAILLVLGGVYVGRYSPW